MVKFYLKVWLENIVKKILFGGIKLPNFILQFSSLQYTRIVRFDSIC